MKVLQVNDWDRPSRHFNGYDLNQGLRKLGHQATLAVIRRESQDADVVRITRWGQIHQAAARRISYYGSCPGLAADYSKALRALPTYQQADVIHYHLIHNNLIGLSSFPSLTHEKPSVWTWHDPWAVTGHCVHPRECDGWKTGCNPCPHLDEYFPIKRDCAHSLWELKKRVYTKMDADIVVSSDFMLDFARNSPLGQLFPRVHKIPFGIRIDQYGQYSLEYARAKLGIPAKNFVIAFRCEPNPYKGTNYAYRMLEQIKGVPNVSVLTVGFGSMPKKFGKWFQVIDLGWQDDLDVMGCVYAASDVFLMPSVAESFGLMAIEAMASRCPVLCFEGTALPAVTFAPKCGIAVPKGDVDALVREVLHLRDYPQEARRKGELGRQIAKEHYCFEDYVQRHEELYEELLARKQRNQTGE